MPAAAPATDNRTAILLAAERLFAEYGLHGASLRQISEEARQKNASAIQYHFGSRDQLVQAVFAMRMSQINPRRQTMLDKLAATERLGDLRSLAGVLVWPLAEELRPRAQGNHYLQFLSRASREKLLAIELAPPDLMTAWTDTLRHIKAALRFLPDAAVSARIQIASEQCVATLAAFEADGPRVASGLDFQVETLIDMLTAGLGAPLSPPAMTALDTAQRG